MFTTPTQVTLFVNCTKQTHQQPSEQDEHPPACSSLHRHSSTSASIRKYWRRISSPTTENSKFGVYHKMQDRADHNLGHQICGDSRKCVQHRIREAMPDPAPAEMLPHNKGGVPDRQ